MLARVRAGFHTGRDWNNVSVRGQRKVEHLSVAAAPEVKVTAYIVTCFNTKR